MSDLPARGDPEDLGPYCRYLLFNSAATTTEVVDHAGLKPNKERSARRIGRFIGAVHVTDDELIRIAPEGVLIGYEADDDGAMRTEGFLETLRGTAPYRSIIERIREQERIEYVRHDPVVTQTAFQEVGALVTGSRPSTQQVNVLMKLLQAAGIGEFRVGRKGVETRFILADGDPTALDAVCTPERITIGQLPTRSLQPPLDAYSAPEVSTQLQVALDGSDPEAVAELITAIETAVDRVQLGNQP